MIKHELEVFIYIYGCTAFANFGVCMCVAL